MELRNRIFYTLKPIIPRFMQLILRRKLVRFQMERCKDVWPIDDQAGAAPAGWTGWPDGKRFALVLTHDVDTARGFGRCLALADVEERLGFRSSFNFVPLRYAIRDEVLTTLRGRGFEIGVHGLYHDGKYYESRDIFQERAKKINLYLKKWECTGYRAPCMLHKLDWFHDLHIEYDASTFDTDPFEPNSCGARTIFPFIVTGGGAKHRYVEMPYTMPQDFTLFILMRERNIDVWRRKLEWVVRHGGVVLMNTHPDYMNMNGQACGREEYPAGFYEQILRHIQDAYQGQFWHVLPRDLARYWVRTAQDTHRDACALRMLVPAKQAGAAVGTSQIINPEGGSRP